MKLVSIEPTPNPNSMKLNLDEHLPKGVSSTYTAADKKDCPDYIARLLQVPGVKSLFHMADFIAVQRDPRVDWQALLARAREAFGEPGVEPPAPDTGAEHSLDTVFGEVRVELQMFRGLPMLVKLGAGGEMLRAALPDRFTEAVERAASASSNMLGERRWVDQGARYGELQEVARAVIEEIAAAYDEVRLDELVREALASKDSGSAATPGSDTVDTAITAITPITALPEDPDWRVRYAALARIHPEPAAIGLFAQVLDDPHSSVRRLAVVYLGLTNDSAAVPLLCKALEDRTVAVRRTAGDALSDLADPRAIGPMTKALEDSGKLVRWRAARFLYEIGDESALPALHRVKDDPEFEVRLQVRMAIERIEGGHSGQGSIWQQMTRPGSES